MSDVNMYKPKRANVEKLDRYVEQLKRHGILRDDEPVGTKDGSGYSD